MGRLILRRKSSLEHVVVHSAPFHSERMEGLVYKLTTKLASESRILPVLQRKFHSSVKKLPTVMEPEIPLPCSQEPTAAHYHEPVQP
jgi:hypothetical protein